MNTEKRILLFSILISSTLCLFMISCGLFKDSNQKVIPGQEDVYAGTYSQGIEDSDFKPCIAQDEIWRISEIQDTASFFYGLREVSSNPVYMELRGVPSDLGEYRGFFMVYDREINVKRVVSVRNLKEKDCSALQELY